MKLGLQISRFNWPDGIADIAPRLAQIAQTADALGFASLWVMDHFFQYPPVGPAEDPMLESYSTLSYLAALTQRIRLGALVSGVVYRYPGVLVKTVTTLDVLSGGRAYFGIGAAGYERDAQGLGVASGSATVRFERLEETVQIAKQMWSGEVKPFHGKHYQLAETLCSPLPLSQPHPPILIGGGGEKKTLRLVAQYADACNLQLMAEGIGGIQRKLDILKRHCDDLARPYDAIERTVLGAMRFGPDGQNAADLIATCRSLANLGVQHFILSLRNVHEITPLEIIGREVIHGVSHF